MTDTERKEAKEQRLFEYDTAESYSQYPSGHIKGSYWECPYVALAYWTPGLGPSYMTQ
jgi:hypothetical protein